MTNDNEPHESSSSAADAPASSRDQGPERFASYVPPRTNDVPRPLLPERSLTEAVEQVGRGFDADVLERLASAISVSADAVRRLAGTTDPALADWMADFGRLVEDGLFERLAERAAETAELLKRLELSGEDARVATLPQAEQDSRTLEELATRVEDVVTRLGAWPTTAELGSPAPISGAAADRVDELTRIVDLAKTVFEDESVVPDWFVSPLGALGGKRPNELLDTAAGRERVRDVLYAIEYGHVA